jgi:drug/metabolite transporter (DMT)-like permease
MKSDNAFLKVCSYLLVGMLWGCTNPFLKAGSESGKKEPQTADNRSYFYQLKVSVWKFLKPSVFIPIAINQTGSVAFYYLLATDDISTAVPICNALTFAFTGITGWLLGEKVYRPKLFIAGIMFVIIGIAICAMSS